MAIEYQKTGWVNDLTPLNQDNMNNIEEGVNDVVNQVNKIPDWVIKNQKPMWATAEGVGADNSGAAQNAVGTHNLSSSAHNGVLAPKVHTHTVEQLTDFPHPTVEDSGKVVSVGLSGDVVLSELSDVAKTGNYNDLSNKPVIPTQVSELNNDKGYVTAENFRKSASGAYSGGYITVVRDFVCGFTPTSVTIAERLDGRVTSITTKTEDYHTASTSIVFTSEGFTAISSVDGEFNRNGYTYQWLAYGQQVGQFPTVDSSDNGKIMEVINGSWGLSDALSSKVSIAQGSEHVNKIMTINQSGNVVPSTPNINTLSSSGALKGEVPVADGSGGVAWMRHGEPELFWCDYGSTPLSRIIEAWNHGEIPVCEDHNRLYVYSQLSGQEHDVIFTNIDEDGNVHILSVIDNGTSEDWTETTISKVTSISSGSTDNQYPSAKCVYDNLTAKVNVEQGVAHAGKVMTVNSSGVVEAADAPKELFWCTYGTTTYAEITNAISNGKLPVIYAYNTIIPCSLIENNSSKIIFSITYALPSGSVLYLEMSVNTSNTWNGLTKELCTNPMTAVGDMIYYDYATGETGMNPRKLARGTEGQVLTMGSGNARIPGWVSPSWVNTSQGVSHAGEFLVVGPDGNVTTTTMAQWQGGSY